MDIPKQKRVNTPTIIMLTFPLLLLKSVKGLSINYDIEDTEQVTIITYSHTRVVYFQSQDGLLTLSLIHI